MEAEAGGSLSPGIGYQPRQCAETIKLRLSFSLVHGQKIGAVNQSGSGPHGEQAVESLQNSELLPDPCSVVTPGHT